MTALAQPATALFRRTLAARHLQPGDVVEALPSGTFTVRDVQVIENGVIVGTQAMDRVWLVLDDSDNPLTVTVGADELVTIIEPLPADQPEPSWVGQLATINIDQEWLS